MIGSLPKRFEDKHSLMIFLKGFKALVEKHCMTVEVYGNEHWWRNGKSYDCAYVNIIRKGLCISNIGYIHRRTGKGSEYAWMLDDSWGLTNLDFYPLANNEVAP